VLTRRPEQPRPDDVANSLGILRRAADPSGEQRGTKAVVHRFNGRLRGVLAQWPVSHRAIGTEARRAELPTSSKAAASENEAA
jgi:hypothetical protein